MHGFRLGVEVDERHHWGRLDRGTAVIVTDEERMILGRDGVLITYPRDPTRFGDRHPRTTPLFDWDDVSVGSRWKYRTVVNGKVIEHQTTEPVEEVRHIDGALAQPGPRDTVDFGSPVRRTAVSDVWVGHPMDRSVTIWITTFGDGWDGTWVLSGAGIGHHFIPVDTGAQWRTWPVVMTYGSARVGSTLWLDRGVGDRIWTPVDPDGCGTITSIEIEEDDA